jgi:butyrate kinase
VSSAAKPLHLLIINPGSTSTKVALYAYEPTPPTDHPADNLHPIWDETVSHDSTALARFPRVVDQYPLRYQQIAGLLRAKGTSLADVDAVVGRGGLLRKPIASAAYLIDPPMVEEMRAGDPSGQRDHASNLGIILADQFAREASAAQGRLIAAYIVESASVDEMIDVARITGWPQIERKSLSHILSAKAAANRAAREIGKPYRQLNLVVSHLGGGISVTAHRLGQQIDVNQALDGEGPFSPERSGGLPVGDLAHICFSGEFSYAQIRRMIAGQGGLVAHLGTNDAREVERRIAVGDEHARLIYRAMAYAIGKYVGAMAAALGNRPDALVFTGALAHSKLLIAWLREQLAWLAPIYVYPGSDEMQALAAGVLPVLLGLEQPLRY